MKKVMIALLAPALKSYRHYSWAIIILVAFIAAMSTAVAAQAPPSEQPKPVKKSSTATATKGRSIAEPAKPSQDKPIVSISPNQLFFGDREIGMKSDAKALTLKNEGKSAIIVDKVVMKGDFTQSNTCDKLLDSGKSCIISINFMPTETDKRDGSLVVNFKVPNSDSVTSSNPIDLKGRGTVSRLQTLQPVLLIVIIYFMSLLFVRWNMVARPACTHLLAHIESTRAEIDDLVVKPKAARTPIDVSAITGLLDKARECTGGKCSPGKILPAFFDFLFWSRGKELAGWNYLHEAKIMVTSYQPEDTVRAALECAEAELRHAATPTAVGLADRIHVTLAATAPIPLDRWRALLAEARSLIYESDDDEFGNLCVWHRKTMWLIFCSLLLIVCLATFLQNGVLFLLGATGGLLSRLQRALYRADVPTDYGAFWTTLFLSPVVGALAGWSGILLLVLLVKFNILGTAIIVEWDDPYTPIALGIALLLGISERLFTGFVTSLEEKLKAQAQPGSAIPAPSTPLKIDMAQLPDGTVGKLYPVTKLSAAGGKQPYTWGLSSASKELPSGLDLTDGKISGTPKIAGSFKIILQVVDAEKKADTNEFIINIGKQGEHTGSTDPTAAKTLNIDTKQLPEGKIGQKYADTALLVSGGKPPFTWELLGDITLPAWLKLDPSGKIIGTDVLPTVEGQINFTLQVKDAESKTVPQEYTIETKK